MVENIQRVQGILSKRMGQCASKLDFFQACNLSTYIGPRCIQSKSP